MENTQKVIMISGANRGIGLGIAKVLHDAGYHLSLGARSVDQLKEATSGWDESRIFLHSYEASDKDSPKKWVADTLEHFGHIDGLVNNAGILRRVRLLDEEAEPMLDELFDVNVKGPIRLTRAAFDALKNSGEGRVINMVSLSGKRVKSGAMGYPISKFGMLAFHHALRQEGWEHGIRATAICPSFTNTDMVRKHSPLSEQEMTQPEDIGRVVKTIIELPNSASVAELPINSGLEDWI